MADRIEINLLPAEYRLHKKTIRISREIFYPILALVLAAFAMWMWTIVLDGQIRSLRDQSADLKTKIDLNQHLEIEIGQLRGERKVIVQKIQALERITVNKARWVRLMEVLSQDLPDYTWLVTIQERDSANPVLALEGRTFAFSEVATYMLRLKESPYVLSVDLKNIEQVENTRLYRFSLSCVTNQNVGILVESDSPAPGPGGQKLAGKP